MATDLQTEFCTLRDTYIEKQFGRLNEMQRRAVFTTSGPLLILAGAGSGKTTVLVNRIANLIRFGSAHGSSWTPRPAADEDLRALRTAIMTGTDVPAWLDDMMRCNTTRSWNIMAITFTNKAAGELKARLRSMLGDEEGDEVFASTFHSACVRILRRYAEEIGWPRSFTIYDTDDAQRVMKAIYKEQSVDDKFYAVKAALGQIGRWKDQLVDPAAAAQDSVGKTKLELAARLYAVYEKRLQEAGAFDFDGLIYHTVRLLQQHQEVRDYYRERYRYLLVDEYQDTSVAQFQLVSLLTGPAQNICVVGDDDQSIYRFRGATIENILSFEEQYPAAQVIRLEQNYRSTKAILKAANAVISHNRGRKGKTLWTENPSGNKIKIRQTGSESDEAAFVASQIFRLSQGKSFANIAVLYRTNAQSNALEYAFQRNGIPYRIIGGMRFFDRAEVKDMLAYLCLINNRSDDLRLRRIINLPPRGIGAKTLETVNRLAAAEEMCLYSVVADAANYGPLEKVAGKLTAFSQLIEDLAELQDTLSLPDFYEEVLQRTGYQAMLEAKDDLESRTRLENVRELKSSIISYVENTDDPSLSGFLEEIALYTDLEQYDQGAEAVVLMTMHSAKGLEFDHVFLVGLEEGLFPSSRATTSAEELEEERRLCYVAITRAKLTLTITYARQRMLYGHTTYGRPSRFLSEIPPDCVDAPAPKPQPAYEPQRSSLYGDYDRYTPASGQRREKRREYSSLGAKPQGAKVQFAKGDMVVHRAFGRGMVLSVLPMGNDALLEIAFDEIGTKRLMANTAGAHMTKQ